MLRMLRREDRRLLTGRCTITRGTYPDHADVATDVHCVVRPSSHAVVDVDLAGAEQVAIHAYDVRLPVDQDIARGDVVTVTRSADPLMQGRWLTVFAVVTDEWVTTRIAVCKEDRSNG